MRCSVHIYCVNSLYSQEIADLHHNGLPSEDNREFDWEDELVIKDEVLEITEKKDSVYNLQGFLPDGTQFSHEIAKMRLIELTCKSTPKVQLAVSESMVDTIDIAQTSDERIISIYVKDSEPYGNPIPGVYIASKSFPKALVDAGG
jgi:hypothetical protein